MPCDIMDWAMMFLPVQYREQMSDFQYEECGIRVWKAYNIGPWCLITYSDLGAASQGDTGLKVIEPFGQPTQKGSVGESISHKSTISVKTCNLGT